MRDPLAWLYLTGFKLHQRMARPRKVKSKVICVGNLTVGGSGKTPLVIHLVEQLARRGFKPAVLSRGYGSRSKGLRVAGPDSDPRVVGDEPVLISTRTGAAVFVHENRYKAGLAAAEAGFDPLIMDDGFQNTHLVKDICILVISAADLEKPVKLLPTGRWREPLSSASKADMVIINNKFVPEPKRVLHLPARVRTANMAYQTSLDLRGQRVFGFSGLGDNDSFKRALKVLGAEIVGFKGFSDHHFYSQREISSLMKKARGLRARLITTEKDAVRLKKDQLSEISVLKIEVEIFPGDALSFVYD